MAKTCIAIDGVTSFTGFWFARTLARQGFDVVAFTRLRRTDYEGLKGDRLARLPDGVRLVDAAPTGSAKHLETIRSLPSLAVYARHSTYAENYRSADYLWLQALEQNTNQLRELLAILKAHNAKLCFTGSIFQQGVGVAYPTQRAFSLYGLSKSLTEQVMSFHAETAGVPLGIFMIANPFGPCEEHRFTSSVAKGWLAGQPQHVQSPFYVRDNIHVDLLALCYVEYIRRLIAGTHPARFGPTQYAESQGQFTARFAEAMRARLGVACDFTCATSHAFVEPQLRINTDTVDYRSLGWDESASWDALAAYYLERFSASQG